MGGETFTVLPAVDMEVIAAYEDGVSEGNSMAYTGLLEQTILAFLIPEDRERWQVMRHSQAEVNGITFSDAAGLMRWMLERDAQRPTEPSGSSSPGAASGAASSTGESVSAAATPTA